VQFARTTLRMDRLTNEQLDSYLASGEWEGKAGAFGYQDRLGWVHVIEGSESNVVGLPLELLAEMLREAGSATRAGRRSRKSTRFADVTPRSLTTRGCFAQISLQNLAIQRKIIAGLWQGGTMRLTGSVSYAVGVLLIIRRAGRKRPMTAARIAEGARFPPRFLYRILRRLVAKKLLKGISGPGGGYALARPLREISLWQVVRAVEGRDEPRKLKPVSPRQAKAIQLINDLVERNSAAFRRRLEATSLQKLARTMPRASIARRAPRRAGTRKRRRTAAAKRRRS
jgi:Rrf2 family protein